MDRRIVRRFVRMVASNNSRTNDRVCFIRRARRATRSATCAVTARKRPSTAPLSATSWRRATCTRSVLCRRTKTVLRIARRPFTASARTTTKSKRPSSEKSHTPIRDYYFYFYFVFKAICRCISLAPLFCQRKTAASSPHCADARAAARRAPPRRHSARPHRRCEFASPR